MSPMLDVQRRHAEVFRLRFGERSSKGAPAKLTDAIRVTSPGRDVVAAFADVYGGDVQPWRSPKGDEWEAYLPTTAIAVMVLPGQSLSQWWERWRGSVCERRCDGETETLAGQPCSCPPDIDARMAATDACKPTTRVNVLCPDVEVVGAGAFVSHGLIAAETLPQSIAVAEAALARGLMVPAVLRVVEHKGRRHFVVPQIEIVGVSLQQLTTGEAPGIAGGRRELDRPAPAQLEAGAAPRVERAGPPLPHEIVGEGDPTSGLAGAGTPSPASDDAASARAQTIARRCREAGIDSGEDRHRLIRAATHGAARTGHEVGADLLPQVMAAIVRVKRGARVVAGDEDGTWVLVDDAYDAPVTDGGQAVLDVWDGARWEQEIKGIKGVRVPSLVKQARIIADDLGIPMAERPKSVDEIGGEIAQRLRAWLDERRAQVAS